MENNVKKNYETPEAEKMLFNYRDQVVAASPGGQACGSVYINQGEYEGGFCTDPEHHEYLN